ncbi:MAG TPA: AAA family ATPase [Polyangiaceae bacterium]|nr:AAA family ATPase [Polyangiaceae bacterium]
MSEHSARERDTTEHRTNGRCRIVLTGGPGGGKTTAADLFRREIGEGVVVVPEAATLLFAGGFPRSSEFHAQRSVQRAIYHVQKNLEDVQSALYPERILLCDRGTIDGAAYWPEAPTGFFDAVGSTLEAELARYDAVIFFESAAVGGISVEGGNPTRIESIEQALALDRRLRDIWAQHPRFVIVPHNPSFMKKILFGLAALESIVAQLREPAAQLREPAAQPRSRQ